MQIPGYTILRELGHGGMATVYLARQEAAFGREVALKVMHPQATASPDFAARFEKEGRIIVRLRQHPQIVIIHEFGSSGEIFYFSMEYLPNGTLSDLIHRGLSTPCASFIARSLAQALSFAHSQGVVHRDIKPQNILFRSDDTPVLTDFGIARATGVGADVTQLTSIGMILGSPRYMSPEQSMGKPIDARSDLYSLGVVFYEMLTQELPYQAEDVISLAIKHCTAPIPVLSRELCRYQPLLEKLLAKAPEARFDSAQEFIHALDAVEAGTPAAAPPEDGEATRILVPHSETPALPAIPDPGPSRQWPLVATALALAGILAGAGFWWTLRPSPTPDPPDPPRSSMVERYEALALDHLRDGDLPQSLELVELALDTNPDDARLKALKAQVVERMAADKLQDEAQAQLAAGDLEASRKLIDQGLQTLPGHAGLRTLRDQVERRQRERDAAAARERLEQARAALERGELAESMSLVRDGLALVPREAGLLALETEIQRRLAQQQALQDLVAQATALLERGLPDESQALVEKGLASFPGQAELLALQPRIAEEQARLRSRQLAELRDRTSRLAGRGAFVEALAEVDKNLRHQPGERILTTLRAEILAQRVQHQAQTQFGKARAAFAEQRYATALELAGEGLRWQPDHAELLTLRQTIEAHLAREQTVREAVSRARELLAEQRFDHSLEVIQKALEAVGEQPALRELREAVVTARQQQQEQQARARAEQIAQWLEQARGHLAAGALEAGLKAVDQGLQLDPQQAELIAVRQQIQERQVFSAKMAEQLAGCAARREPDKTLPESERFAAQASAASCYRSLLGLDAGNAEAQAQLAALEQDLARAFAEALEQADPTSAKQALDALESAYPEHSALAEKRARLARITELLPDLVTIAGGCFQMGSPKNAREHEADERSHQVCVKPFRLARQEIQVQEFQRFVEAKHYESDAEYGIGGIKGCWALDLEADGDSWKYHAWANWRKPNKYRDNDPRDPVVCVSKNDVEAYIRWLNQETGQHFRLPTEAEWEYAARAATTSTRFWGNAADAKACRYANTADTGQDWGDGFPCDDGHEWIAPTGQFQANPWGLQDMLGNALEWTCSEYDSGYEGKETTCAPTDSTAPIVLRGGAWNSAPAAVRSAYRNRNYPESRYNFAGFRLASDVPPKR